ncbi:MAG TPA: mechanosensitive ion channel family protein [Polyangia bacterium]|nr:mechanosensitive ion channel family protein [Polyangia bacterium]
MAEPASAMFHPPPGWRVHDFWGNLTLVAHGHSTALTLALAGLVLLLLGRALLPASERSRLRVALASLVIYFLSLPVRASLLSGDLETYYDEAQLVGSVALAWALIGVAGLLLFDLLGRRVGVPKILRDLTTTVAMLVALVVLLRESGVNLLSIVTTSAVLTAVIGLALQDTLGNLLSGVALQLESSIKIGDWIRVEDKPIGRVREIRWRSTVIQTKNGDLVIIPNGMMTKGVITNFNKDELENRRWVYFSVGLRHPPNDVQRVIVDALGDVPNVSKRTPPDCIVWGFKESVIEYAVRYRLIDYLPDDPTDSEVRKRIWYALSRSGIEIPFPAHNVLVTQRDEARAQEKAERDTRNRADAVARVGLFAPLGAAERESLARALRLALYGAGEVILRAGDPGDSLYIIRAGEVSVRIHVDGLEKEVARLGVGQFFGEMSLMTGEPRHATVVAFRDAECYVVDRAAFQQIVAGKEALVAEIGKLLHERDLELRGQKQGLSVEAARLHADRQALLGRIKNFFGFA